FVSFPPSMQYKVFQQPSLSELKCSDLNPAEHNSYTADTLESNNIRTGQKHEEPPVKRSRSLSPKSSFREAEELKKLKILRAAYGKHEERLQTLQTNYRALKEQLKLENSRYQHTGFCQLFQDNPDVMWNELAFFKREHKKLYFIYFLIEPVFKLGEDNGVKGNTPKRYMREVSHEMLQKIQQLKRRFKAIEGGLKKQKEVNKDLLNEKIYLKESSKVQKEDTDTQKRELETLLKRIFEVKKEKAELQLVIDEKEKEAASLKRQVTEANRLRNESEDLLSQVQEQKCLLDRAKAVAISGQCNCKITGTKVKLKTAKKKSSLGHHGAFHKQSIKVMSNVFENFSKDGWEDVSESSESETPTSESLGTVILKTMQNIDPLSDRSNKKKKQALQCAKGRNITIQKLGYAVTLLQEKIKSLKNKTVVASIKNVKERNEKLTNQLHLVDQRLQINKLTIECGGVLTSNLAKWQQEKENLQGKLKLREHLSQTTGKSEATPPSSKNIDLEMKQLQCKLKNPNTEISKQSTTIKSLRKQVEEKEWIRELEARFAKLESEIETECNMTELETAASQELRGLAKQALETLQKELLLTSDKVEEFKTFVKGSGHSANLTEFRKDSDDALRHMV
ncbi:hypothetical protein HGM15179_013346, partial [Zosterops borbonicus]